MNKEEILAMEAGIELDKLIATKVMGWQGKLDYSVFLFDSKVYHKYRFSTSILAAWQVVEKLETDGYGHKHLKYSQNRDEEYSWIFMQPGYGIFEATGKTIQEAICKAALLTKETL